MRKVALVTYCEIVTDDYYGSKLIPNTITDWVEVDDKDYEALYRGASKNNWAVIEQPLDQKEAVIKCVEDGIKLIREQEEKAQKLKELAEQKKLVALAKKQEKDRKKYEALKAKYG